MNDTLQKPDGHTRFLDLYTWLKNVVNDVHETVSDEPIELSTLTPEGEAKVTITHEDGSVTTEITITQPHEQ